MDFFEKTIGLITIFLLFVNFLFLILAESQQKRILKGEERITGFGRYHKSHKWLKANIQNLSEKKQIEYKKYLFKRKIHHLSLFVMFILYVLYNLLYNL